MRLLREVLPGRAEVPAHVRPAGRGRGAHLRAVRRAASTRWTRCAPRRSAPWRRTASTGCSCPRPRTTATWSRSPPCWSCWTTSASPAGVRPSEAQLGQDHGAPAEAGPAAQVGRHAPVSRAGRAATWKSSTRRRSGDAHRLLTEYAASRRNAPPRRRGGPGRRRLRHHAAEEAAVLLAEGVRRDDRDAPGDHDPAQRGEAERTGRRQPARRWLTTGRARSCSPLDRAPGGDRRG